MHVNVCVLYVYEALSFLAEEYVDLTVAPWTQEWLVVCVCMYVSVCVCVYVCVCIRYRSGELYVHVCMYVNMCVLYVCEALSFLAEEYVDLTAAPWTQGW
jgi:hypothetical protein